MLEGFELPLTASCGSRIKCGDIINMSFGHEQIERIVIKNAKVFFDEERLDFSIKQENGKTFHIGDKVHRPIYEIVEKYNA